MDAPTYTTGHEYIDANLDTYPDRDADSIPDTLSNTGANANFHGDTNRYLHANQDSVPLTDPNVYTYRDSDTNHVLDTLVNTRTDGNMVHLR